MAKKRITVAQIAAEREAVQLEKWILKSLHRLDELQEIIDRKEAERYV